MQFPFYLTVRFIISCTECHQKDLAAVLNSDILFCGIFRHTFSVRFCPPELSLLTLPSDGPSRKANLEKAKDSANMGKHEQKG